MPNRLANSASPYLLQHADNPVDWYPWGEEAFAAARDTDKPLLISVGYSSCHWCHVMAHECFEDREIAALMNDLFVNVKVDREERPDVDSIYMQALQSLTGSGGWPMTIFATPDGKPFYAGTYFPPDDHHGRPGFPTVVRALAGAYRAQHAEVVKTAGDLTRVIAPTRLPSSGELSRADIDSAITAMLARIDVENGGFGNAPKFPQPVALDFLIQGWASGNDDCRIAVTAALSAIAGGGLHDHLGGGFHRYCVDATWTVPHFEKMLYDNAQLTRTFLHAFQLSADDRWHDVVESTLGYMRREMRGDGGAFAASQDADSPGGEGAFYTWTEDQIIDLLGSKDAWHNSPYEIADDGVLVLRTRTVAATDAPLRERLFSARSERPAPERDGKVITSWNALAIEAFAEAGAALQRTDWLTVATEAAHTIVDRAVSSDGDVLHTWLAGAISSSGFLEDAALLGNALITLYEATGDSHWYDTALRIAVRTRARFWDEELGFCDTPPTAEQLIVKPRSLDDNPLPTGQSGFARLSLRLFGLTTDSSWQGTAHEILSPLRRAISRVPLAVAAAAAAGDWLVCGGRQIAIAAGDHAPSALVHVVQQRFTPHSVLAWGGAPPLLDGKTAVEGKPAAYVCKGFACNLPVTDAADLSQQLEQQC